MICTQAFLTFGAHFRPLFLESFSLYSFKHHFESKLRYNVPHERLRIEIVGPGGLVESDGTILRYSANQACR